MPESTLIPEITPERGAELNRLQDAGAVADQAVMDSAEVFKALGRIETSAFFARIGNISAAQVAQQIRENKKYKGLPYTDQNGNRNHVSTFDEFCEAFLGKTGRYVRDLLNNLHVLGPELYESAEIIGFKARDYRALKALPAEEQEVVRTALASESKDEVLDILQDMAARHQGQKEAAKKEAEGLRADLEARDRVLADKAKGLDKAQMELAKLKSLPPSENVALKLATEATAVKTLDNSHIAFLAETNKFFQVVADILDAEAVSSHTKTYATQTVQRLAEELTDFLAAYGIAVDFQGMVQPAWAQALAKADIETNNTGARG